MISDLLIPFISAIAKTLLTNLLKLFLIKNSLYSKSKLDAANAIEARIFCTGASKGKGGGFRVPLPQPDFVWEYLAAYHGHEFLSQTFTKFRQEIVDCDLVACYTDADICDKRLTPSLWRSRGTSCVGLYCGDVGQVDVMNRYFDFSIARETPSALFHEYLRLVKRLLDK